MRLICYVERGLNLLVRLIDRFLGLNINFVDFGC
jgi:hypothetical protein